VSYADCALRQWNSGINWCVKAGGPCLACTEPGFPDVGPALYEKIPMDKLPRLAKDGTSIKLVAS